MHDRETHGLYRTWSIVREWIRHKSRKYRRRLNDQLWKRVGYAVFLLLFGYFLLVGIDFATFKIKGQNDSSLNYVNILTIVGLALTVFGFLYSYREFKTAHERITGYSRLYECVMELLAEIRQKKAHKFFCYGSTPLPGNVSFDQDGEIDRYCSELLKLYRRNVDGDNTYGHVTHASIIVPTKQRLLKNYEWFQKRHIKGIGRLLRSRKGSYVEWQEFVEERHREADKLKTDIEAHDRPNRYVFTPRDHRASTIEHAYFWSNGVRIIYAMPLHFVDSIQVGREPEVIIPHIVGFTTTDYEIVRAYAQHFGDLSGYQQRRLLEMMYTNHLVSPANITRKLRHDLTETTVEELAEDDHDHFGKKAATQACISALGLTKESVVLDIGSGLGGPARYIAAQAQCQVVGVELLPDRYEYAVELTQKLSEGAHHGLADQVRFILGDATQLDLPERSFSHVVSFLSILHFAEKVEFLKWIGTVLKPGGKLFIDDYCQGKSYTKVKDDEGRADKLLSTISCPSLLGLESYRELLEAGGIHVDDVKDMTQEWYTEAADRRDRYRDAATKQQLIDAYGSTEAVNRAEKFADGVFELFKDEHLMGVRLIGTRKPD